MKTAREKIERAFHVSFKLPEQAKELLDEFEKEVLWAAVDRIEDDSHSRRDSWGYHDDPRYESGMQHAADLINPDKES